MIMIKVLNGMEAVMNHKVFILFDNHYLSLPAVTLQGVCGWLDKRPTLIQ